MGLDAVELVMEVEESFGIKIPDEQASRMATVGELYALVLEKTRDRSRESQVCLSAATFYELRRNLSQYLPDTLRLRPNWYVEQTLPKFGRRKLWNRLQKDLDVRFPQLRHPWWVVLAIILVAVVTAIGTYLAFAPGNGGTFAIFLSLLIAISNAALLMWLTVPLATRPLENSKSFRGLINQIVSMNYAKLSERFSSWTATDVWYVLVTIIVEQLAVPRAAVTPDASFVHDLGME